jgi:hypothetical protein
MQNIDWKAQGLIPGLLYFQNGGEYTGSVTDFKNRAAKEFRYKIEGKDNLIKTYVWYGPFNFQNSKIEDEGEFELSEEGRDDMLNWLKQKYESMIE